MYKDKFGNAVDQFGMPIQQVQPQEPKKKVGGLRGALANFLPTIGGAVGTVGGGILGSVLPGAGTVAGGAAGGVTGSGLGEFLRQKLTGEDTNMGSIAREGALGAIPGVLKGAKAVKGAIAGAKTAADEAVGRSATLGNRAIGTALTGEKAILQQQADEVLRFNDLAKENIRRKSVLGGNAIGSSMRGSQQQAIQQADEVSQFNRLARENIQKLAQERATQGIPLPGGGVLVRPGQAPSFATEGIEKLPVPNIPTVPARYQKPIMPKDVNINSSPAIPSFGEGVNLKSVPQLPEIPSYFSKGITQAGGKAVDTGLDAAKVADKSPLSEKTFAQRMSSKGLDMESRAGGFGIGAKVAGKNPLEIKDTQRISDWLKSKNVATGAPRNRLEVVEGIKSEAAKNIDNLISKTENVRLQPVEISKLTDDFLNDVQKLPGVNESLIKRATEYAESAAKSINSPRSLIDFKRNLDEGISFVKSADAATASEQQLAKILRGKLVEFSNKAIPGIKKYNDDYHNSSDAIKFLIQGAKNPKGFQIPWTNTNMFGEQIQGAKSKLGGIMQKNGINESTSKTNGFKPFVRPALEQGATRVASNVLLGTPLVGQGQEESALPLSPQATIPEEVPPQETAPSRSQQLFEASMQLLQSGDIEGAKALSAFAQQAAEFDKAATEKPLSAEAARTVSNAQAGLESLDLLRGQLAEDPSLQTKSAVSGAFNPLGLTSRVLGTGEYENARQQAVDIIARLRTGAAITKEEEGRFLRMLPQPADDEATIQQKLGLLERQFQRVASRSGSAGTDLQQAAGY